MHSPRSAFLFAAFFICLVGCVDARSKFVDRGGATNRATTSDDSVYRIAFASEAKSDEQIPADSDLSLRLVGTSSKFGLDLSSLNPHGKTIEGAKSLAARFGIDGTPGGTGMQLDILNNFAPPDSQTSCGALPVSGIPSSDGLCVAKNDAQPNSLTIDASCYDCYTNSGDAPKWVLKNQTHYLFARYMSKIPVETNLPNDARYYRESTEFSYTTFDPNQQILTKIEKQKDIALNPQPFKGDFKGKKADMLGLLALQKGSSLVNTYDPTGNLQSSTTYADNGEFIHLLYVDDGEPRPYLVRQNLDVSIDSKGSISSLETFKDKWSLYDFDLQGSDPCAGNSFALDGEYKFQYVGGYLPTVLTAMAARGKPFNQKKQVLDLFRNLASIENRLTAGQAPAPLFGASLIDFFQTSLWTAVSESPRSCMP